jgi:polyhydroxybutyrate depolymerase
MKTPSSIIVIILLFLSVKPSIGQITLQDSFIVGGLQRSFTVYVPAIYSADDAVPLVLNLHGYGSNNFEQLLYTNFQPIADTANFIMVLPNGSLDITNTLSWNTFGISTVDDVGFISQLIDTISSRYTIDSERIYSTGMSNGGFMSYELACQLSDKITAIASVTGSMLTSKFVQCNPSHPIPVMQIHGTMDGTVPYDGNFAFSSIDSLLGFWRIQNNCFPIAEFNNVPDIDLTDNCTAEHYVWNSSTNMSSVEFYKIIGGDHSWPGAIINLNTTNMDFSASKEIWRFFSQYRKSELISSNSENIAEGINLKLFPNPNSGNFKISIDSFDKFNYSIIDNHGRQITEGKSITSPIEIKLDQSGLFILIVSNGKSQTTKRFIVQ